MCVRKIKMAWFSEVYSSKFHSLWPGQLFLGTFSQQELSLFDQVCVNFPGAMLDLRT